MPYCNKCGKFVAGSETGGLCEDCKDHGRFHMPGNAPSHMIKKEYTFRDSAITFIIVFTLVVGGVLLLGRFLG